MISYLSIALVVLFTSYSVFYTYKRRETLSCMAGMMISMTIGMMSSITLGVILGIILKHDLSVSTLIAILFGMVAGYAAGKPVSLMAALDGMLAAIMGGMMGAMLGVMLTATSEIMVLFMDILYIFIMTVLTHLIDEQSGKAKADNRMKSKSFIGSINTLAAGIVTVVVLLIAQNQRVVSSTSEIGATSTQIQTSSERTEGYQIASIQVHTSGYGPKNIELNSGTPTQINFKTERDAGCLRQVVSNDLGINVILQEGNNYITLKDVKPGTYSYTCGMGMFGGTITIK